MKVFTIAFTTKDTVDIAEYFGVEMENNVNKSNLPHRQCVIFIALLKT